jgi:hypothetical protein
VLAVHCTQALLEQCGFAVGQSVSPMHCTHPGVFMVPQSTGPVPPSGLTVTPPPSSPLDVPLDEPLAVPPDDPLDAPLDVPLELPPPEAPSGDVEPPSEPVAFELLPLQPTAIPRVVATARPRQVFKTDMRTVSFVFECL